MDSSDSPLISIIINCHNGENYLKQAIDSIYAQSYENWEIVFWDNASDDCSASIAKNYCEKLRYFKSEEKIPLYKARNEALKKCKGVAISFLDSDDVWIADKLQKQVELFISGNQFVYGGYELIDEKESSLGFVNALSGTDLTTRKLLLNNIISIGTVLISADLIRTYMFDGEYELLGDFDLWVRLSKNCGLCGIPEPVEKSRQHSNNTSDLYKYKWLKERRYFYRKFLKNTDFYLYPEISIYILKTEYKGLFQAR